MPTDFEFFVDPLAQGRVTPRALLETTGTIIAPFIPEFLRDKQHLPITRLAGDGWFFNIGYTAGSFVIQRNNGQAAIDYAWCRERSLPKTVLASWSLNSLIISFGTHFTHHIYPQIAVASSFIVPPSGLIRWVRMQELSSVDSFNDEDQFLLRVHSSLQRFEERLRPLLSRDVFWDIERKGAKTVCRRPKRERDIQSALHAMLVDHMQLSNIDILPEARSPAGAVDLLLSSALTSGISAKICLEFKNAHSSQLVSGLATQLRQYMNNLGVENGAYCILDYRCKDFRLPNAATSHVIAALHQADEPAAVWPNRPIKIHWIKLGNGGA